VKNVTKFENINVYIDYTRVDGTDRYDVKVITLEKKETYRLLTLKEVNTMYNAFEIMDRRGKHSDV
jgi:hypothetical protein